MGFTVPEAQDDQSGKWEAPTGRVHDTPAAAPITGKKHEMTSEMYLIDMLSLAKEGRHLFSTEEETSWQKHFHDRLPCLVTRRMTRTCFLQLEARGVLDSSYVCHRTSQRGEHGSRWVSTFLTSHCTN
jgi:hypothetical protein